VAALARAGEEVEYSLPISIGDFRQRLLRGPFAGRLRIADAAVALGAGFVSCGCLSSEVTTHALFCVSGEGEHRRLVRGK
jgi:hypothetical protein